MMKIATMTSEHPFWFLPVLLLTAAVVHAGGQVDFQAVDLDALIDRAPPPEGKGRAVFLIPPRRIRFEARVLAPPEPKRSEYLKQALAAVGVRRMPKVDEGLELASSRGRTVFVYLSRYAAGEARKIRVGDWVTVHGYHVYNTKYGPGILVAGIVSKETPWTRLKAWLQENL